MASQHDIAMKTKALIALVSAVLGISSFTFAGTTYQVTGPVLEVTDTKIVVQKENEKWEIARTPGTKVTGELKVGAKVTVHYTMTATSVEVKPAAKDAPADKPAKK